MHPYITVWKKNKYVGIFYNNDINDKCEKNFIGKDYTYKLQYSKIAFRENKKNCTNNFSEIEEDIGLK